MASRPSVDVVCSGCGSNYLAIAGEVTRRKNRMFCSRACYERNSYVEITARFWRNFESRDDPNACWIWKGPTVTAGYGKISYFGKLIGAHRVSWLMSKGDIPKGMHVLHRCDNPPCVNPDHLFLGTNRDNIYDRNRKGRGGKKLTNESAAHIKQLLEKGTTQTAIARMMGVNQTLISAVDRGVAWKHV